MSFEPELEAQIRAMFDELQQYDDHVDAGIDRLSAARKRAFGPNPTAEDQTEWLDAERDGAAAHQRFSEKLREIEVATGIPKEILDALDPDVFEEDAINRLPRGNSTARNVPSTGLVEDVLPSALENVERLINQSWLRDQSQRPHRLGEAFLDEPLSLIGGVRLESERQSVHRLAQSILVARDMLAGVQDFDWFAGALLIPQIAALGNCVDLIKENVGGGDRQLKLLSRKPSAEFDSLVYETLVAATCARHGREVEFIPPTREKSPDLRVRGFRFPIVVECKRKPHWTQADVAEEASIRPLFAALREECVRFGLWGVFDLVLNVEAADAPINEVVTAARRQRYFVNPAAPTQHSWGSIAFHPRNKVIELPMMVRTYGPNYLSATCGWDTDLPPFDGLICQVKNPASFIVDECRELVALRWSNECERAKVRRSWAAVNLFNEALQQIPPGEMGVIYVAYCETARESAADARTNQFMEKIQGTSHSAGIRIAAAFLTRLIPRALGDGAPDLIENGIRLMPELYGDPYWFAQFPATVFTPSA